nr:MAG TPA: hypothetical protein [Caudoviricetes sp.]
MAVEPIIAQQKWFVNRRNNIFKNSVVDMPL